MWVSSRSKRSFHPRLRRFQNEGSELDGCEVNYDRQSWRKTKLPDKCANQRTRPSGPSFQKIEWSAHNTSWRGISSIPVGAAQTCLTEKQPTALFRESKEPPLTKQSSKKDDSRRLGPYTETRSQINLLKPKANEERSLTLLEAGNYYE